MRGRRKRSLALGILCCLLVFMGIGFAAARTTLNITGTSTITNAWDVRLSNVLVTNASDGVTNNEEFTNISQDGVTANVNIDFVKPGDYITYDVLIENNGSIEAVVGALDIVLSADNEMDKDLFIVETNVSEETKLQPGESLNVEVTIKYREDAQALPSGAVNFEIKLNYSQTESEGNGTPGGGTSGEVTPKDWDFEVDDEGAIVAYNFEKGTDVVVPATNYEGKAIQKITKYSFLSGNVNAFIDEESEIMYGLIKAEEPDYTNIKNKVIFLMTMECGGNSTCEKQYKSVMYECKDSNTCYNVLAVEEHAKDPSVELKKVSIPDTAVAALSAYVNPDPNVSITDSLEETVSIVTSLDLTRANSLKKIDYASFFGHQISDLKLGNSIDYIGVGAFYKNQIDSLTLGNNVTTIGDYAFCENQIDSLTLGNNVTTIGEYAFSSNQISGELELPNSIITIGDSAFYSNQISGELVIPASVKTLSGFDCNQITSLVISEGVITIGDSAFSSNQISGELIMPDSIIKIGDSAFSYNQVNTLILGNSVETIGMHAFSDNQISGELVIPNSVLEIKGQDGYTGAFANNQISKLMFASNSKIKEIPYHTFYSNQISGDLIIPESVTAIGGNAFYYNKISNLNLGNNIITIGESAFYDNQISGDLIIPDSVTMISKRAFSDNQISSLHMTHELEIGQEAFNENQLPDAQAFIYENNNKTTGKIISYGGAKRENIVIPSNVTMIGESAFNTDYYNPIKGEIIIPNSVTTIGEWAFYDNKISSLILGDSVTTIGEWAFYDNQISGQLIIPNSLTTIGERAFENNQISDLIIPNSVTTIEEWAFMNNKITSLQMLHELEIGEKAFNNNQLPDSQAFIYENNNKNTNKIIGYAGAKRENIIIPSNVTVIGKNAFGENQLSGELVIPNSVITIEEDAFYNNQITSITIPGSVTTIGSWAFSNQNTGYYNGNKRTLTSIVIKRTEADFLANVTVGNYWYDSSLNPTITYDPS